MITEFASRCGGSLRARPCRYRHACRLPSRSGSSSIPTTTSQNVLTAARALEQINNQITSLQNEAQMLINQARNLASLPYSSLQQLAAVDPAHAAAARPGAAHRLRRPADRPGLLDHLRPASIAASPTRR